MRFRVTGSLVITSLLVAACAQSDGPTAPATPEFTIRGALAPAAAVQSQHQNNLLAIPGVVGVGLGADRGNPALVVLTERAGVRGLPAALGGLPVRVMVTGEIWALQQQPHKKCNDPPCNGGGGGGGGEEGDGGTDPTARFPRPVPIGISTGHPSITAGTIGCRVKKGGQVYALSNNHVYAASNAASNGDDVLQPGAYDGGGLPGDKIGDLSDYQTIVFSTSANNVIDAAIALTTTADLGNSTPSNGYGAPKSQTVAPSVGLRVKKYGRTTKQTKSRISVINATVNVNYGSPGVARFVNQIVIGGGGFSAGGDSGSLIVVEKGSNARKAVGLLFAGSSSATIANPIGPVLSRFNVTIDGQ